MYDIGCLKCLFNNLFILCLYLDGDSFHLLFNVNSAYFGLYYQIMPLFTTGKSRVKGIDRIGPHDKDIYSIIFGSLLGDAHAERRKGGVGTRISFQQENPHVSYLLWLHNFLASRGYCNETIPTVQTRLGKNGVVRKYSRFHTWTYTSFNYIHDLWYVNRVKIVPESIKDYLTPLALAIWLMDDGARVSKGLKFCTNSYTYSDCLLLVQVLYENFGIKASVQSSGAPNQFLVYVWKESMPILREICYPYVIPEMRYKLI
jgi:ubiquinol-cytochrome c reductase cytochrome b subunit